MDCLSDVPNTRQTADEISEDQVHNFLVNVFTHEFTVEYGDNANIEAEDIFEVLVCA